MPDLAAYLGAGATLPTSIDRDLQQILERQRPVARLDTGEKSPHRRVGSGKRRQLTEKQKRDRKVSARREASMVHKKLVELLAEMEEGKHGPAARSIGERWLSDVRPCPGYTYRHGPCGHLRYDPYSCRMKLCPWCQRRRASRNRYKVGKLMDEGYVQEPKLWTLSLPNQKVLTREAVSALGRAVTQLMRRKSMAEVKGGIRGLEVTYRGERGWNLHAHVLLDAPWIAHYPQTDIRWDGEGWQIDKVHGGLAREFTAVCQNFPELRSEGLDLDDASQWYFVDLRRAGRDAAGEVAKYVTKGADLVLAGAGPVVEFLEAFQSVRVMQPFGSFYRHWKAVSDGNVAVAVEMDVASGGQTDSLEEWEAGQVQEGNYREAECGFKAPLCDVGLQGHFLAPGDGADLQAEGPEQFAEPVPDGQLAFPGMCPWPDCEDRANTTWERIRKGVPDSTLGVQLEFDLETRSYRVLVGVDLMEEPRDGPRKRVSENGNSSPGGWDADGPGDKSPVQG